MRLIFKATERKPTHLADDVRFFDSNVKDLPSRRAKKLLQTYPDNFFKHDIPTKHTKPKHKPLTLADISIVVINPYPEVFKTHLLPCIPPEAEFMPLENVKNIYWTSGPKALNEAIGASSNDIVMCAHPDLVLGKKWWNNLICHETRLENWGALGISGWDFKNRITWGKDLSLPYEVQCLDENCLILNRKNGINFDEFTFTSWHCYAADFCLQCHDKGLGVYLVPGVASHQGHSFSEVPGFIRERDETLPILWNKWRGKVSSINMGLAQSKIRGEK